MSALVYTVDTIDFQKLLEKLDTFESYYGESLCAYIINLHENNSPAKVSHIALLL